MLYSCIAFSSHHDAVPIYVRLPAFTGAKDDMGVVTLCFRYISEVKLVFVSDFYYLEAFLDEERRELPQFFKASVAVEDSRKIFGGVVSGDPEIVCHNDFLLCGKFFDGSVGIRQPDFVDVV